MEVKSEKISTQELWARLFKSPSVGDYLEKTGDVCEMLAFSEYISQLCIMECLSDQNGICTFLVQKKDGENCIAKCYDIMNGKAA